MERFRVYHKINGEVGTVQRARSNKGKIEYFVIWDYGPSEWVSVNDLII